MSIHISANNIILFIFMASNTPLYHFFFTHLSASRYLCGLHVFAIVNSAAMNPGVHVSFWIIVFCGYIPWNGTAGSYGINSSVYCFLKNLYFLLHHVIIPTCIATISVGEFSFLITLSNIYS